MPIPAAALGLDPIRSGLGGPLLVSSGRVRPSSGNFHCKKLHLHCLDRRAATLRPARTLLGHLLLGASYRAAALRESVTCRAPATSG